MALSNESKRIFRNRYGVSISEVSKSVADVERIRKNVATDVPKLTSSSDVRYGRGHVKFGESVSAKEADASTLRIISRW